MLNVLLFAPNPHDATSFYRGYGPMGMLKQQLENMTLSVSPTFDWPVNKLVDVVLMQRPFTADHLKMARMVREYGNKSLWVDYDDDLFCLPQDNPAYRIYSKPEVQKSVSEIIARADLVTVSTQALKRKLQPLNKNVWVIPNGFDDQTFFYRDMAPLGEGLYDDKKKPEPANPLILWRGSSTHERDLAAYSEPILAIAKKFPNHAWHFQGFNPWYLTEAIGQKCSVGESMPLHEYFSLIHQLRPEVMIVPLFENEFNKSKSNIAWIEGTFAGAVCLVPNWEEWRMPGAVSYHDQESFFNQLRDILVSAPQTKTAWVNDSWDFIKKNLLVEDLNQLRANAIEQAIATVRRPRQLGNIRISGGSP